MIDAPPVIECAARPGAGHPWAWRQIDGKRCWYRGRAGKNKRLLAWSAPKPVPRVAAELPPPVSLPPPPPVLAAASVRELPPAMPAPVRVVEVPVRVVGGALPPPRKLEAKPHPAPGPGSIVGPLLVIAITAFAAYLIARRRLRRVIMPSARGYVR